MSGLASLGSLAALASRACLSAPQLRLQAVQSRASSLCSVAAAACLSRPPTHPPGAPAGERQLGREELECVMPLPAPHGLWRWQRRTQVMGIINVTPDSFSDGGRHYG